MTVTEKIPIRPRLADGTAEDDFAAQPHLLKFHSQSAN